MPSDPFKAWQGSIDESFNSRFFGAVPMAPQYLTPLPNVADMDFGYLNPASSGGTSDFWRSPLVNTSTLDFGYLNSSSATNDTFGSFFGDDAQSKANGWFNSGASAITGLPSGNTGGDGPNPSAANSPAGAALTSFDFASYFVRAIVVILGFIFVAAGLYMFGGNKILERVTR